jgi:hypothetical protein
LAFTGELEYSLGVKTLLNDKGISIILLKGTIDQSDKNLNFIRILSRKRNYLENLIEKEKFFVYGTFVKLS